MPKLPPKAPQSKRPWLDSVPPPLRAAIERLGGPELATELGAGPSSRPPAPPDRFEPESAELSEQPRRIRRTAQRLERKHEQRQKNSYVARLARAHARHQNWLDRHREKMRERRGPEATPPPEWSRELWRDCQDIMFDLTGRAARIHLSRLRYPAWATMVRRCALGEVAGEVTRDWSSERARALACSGLAMCRSAERTKFPHAKFSFLLRGFTRGAFAALVQGPRLRPVHVNTIGGVHRAGADAHSGQLGYLPALAAYGLCRRVHVPPERCEPWECWTVRRRQADGSVVDVVVSSNRYQVVNPNPYDGHLDVDARTRLLELANGALSGEALRLRPRTSRPPAPLPAPPATPAPPD